MSVHSSKPPDYLGSANCAEIGPNRPIFEHLFSRPVNVYGPPVRSRCPIAVLFARNNHRRLIKHRNRQGNFVVSVINGTNRATAFRAKAALSFFRGLEFRRLATRTRPRKARQRKLNPSDCWCTRPSLAHSAGAKVRKRWFSSCKESNVPTQTTTRKLNQLFHHASWPLVDEQIQDCAHHDLKSTKRMSEFRTLR